MKSMTGFGRGEAKCGGARFSVEVSSVNRKQLDIAPVLPRDLAAMEAIVRRMVAAAVSRGRVNVKVQVERLDGSSRTVVADKALMAEYAARLNELLGKPPTLTASDLLCLPGVLELRESEMEDSALESGLSDALGSALAAWDAMRADEGRHLKDDITARLQLVVAGIDGIDSRADGVVVSYRQQLLARLGQAGIPVDLGDDRIVREIGMFAERCDTSEERVRLRSHLLKFRSVMDSGEPAGRPLDFLLQEMNREVNTIGSKANDAAIAQHVVALKTELEKIREQIQNVE